MAVVNLERLSKRYDRTHRPAVEEVSLTIGHGEFMVFLGPSGCGKTTTLRMIAGLESITSGRLSIDGRIVNAVPAKDRDIAMVFQSYALYPHMSVRDNLAFGLKRRAVPRAEIARRVDEVAAALGLSALLDRRPHALSGGQRQRVAIGRAIVRDPKVFLFDEPLSNLDAALRVGTRIEIAKLHEETGATMIYVTHDQVEAMTLADRIVVLNAGRVEQVGAPLDLYHRPANLFVAGFIGSPRMNFLPGVVEGGEGGGCRLADGTLVPLPPGRAAPGARVTLGIRPEHLVEGPADGALEGRVDFVEQLGETHLLYVRTGDTMVTAKGPGGAARKAGDSVRLGIPAEACHLFDAEGTAIR